MIYSIVYAASENDHCETVELLINKKAIIDTKDKHEQSALHLGF